MKYLHITIEYLVYILTLLELRLSPITSLELQESSIHTTRAIRGFYYVDQVLARGGIISMCVA